MKTAVAHKNRVFLAVHSNILADLMMFEFEGRMVTLYKDSRFKHAYISELIWNDDQLIVVDGARRLFSRFNADLEYKSKSDFDEMDWGSVSGMKTRFFLTDAEGRTLITLQDPEDRGKIALARVDFSEMTVSVLTRRIIDSKQVGYWIPNGDLLLFVHSNTGQIDLVHTTTFKTERTIRPGIEPVKKKRFTKPWRPPYFWILHNAHGLDGKIYWGTKAPAAPVDTTYYRHSLLKMSSDGTLSFHGEQNFPLAIHGNEALVIDWEGPELLVVPVSEVP